MATPTPGAAGTAQPGSATPAASTPVTRKPSIGSQASQTSTGIGSGQADNADRKNEDLPPNLTPEGLSLDPTVKVYDAIVYLIYCPEHDKIAVTNVERARCVWLPFVCLPEGVTWRKASVDGVTQIIGNRDAEQDASVAAKKAPVYEMDYLNVLRIQMPTEKFVTRLANLVVLKRSPESTFKCCQRSPRINWLRAADILGDRIDKIWGPELKNFTKLMIQMNKTEHDAVISEFTVQNSYHYLMLEDSAEQKLLRASQVKPEHVAEIYENFVEHCYPAFSMSYEAFKYYLIRYGFDKKDPRLSYLFGAFSLYGYDYLDFHELLLGLVAMEPNTKHLLEARLKFIFRYYDGSRSGLLTIDEFVVLVQDIAKASAPNTEMTNEQLMAKTEEAVRCVGMNKDQKIAEGNFMKAIQSGRFKGTELLCRSPKSILGQISRIIQAKTEKTVKNVNHDGFLVNRRKTKGTCFRCQAQNYDYSLHCITLDTSGRCVEPRIISDQWIEPVPNDGMNEHKYSIEYVFGNSSMPNIIIDLVKDFYHKWKGPNVEGVAKPIGLMASREDWTVFSKYLTLLCESLKGLLQSEDKLVKINAPALVIGDIQGNLHDLFVMEKHFWHSFPVVANNYIFLGNYSGLLQHGVECLAYLFSMKLLSPNKVFLLRGTSEMRAQNKRTLLFECQSKYGNEFGRKIYESLNDIFDRLPFATIVDETIFCSHSGISHSTKIGALNQLPRDISSVYKDAPIAYELLVNEPFGIRDSLSKVKSNFKDSVATSVSMQNMNSTKAGNGANANGNSSKKQKSAISSAVGVTGFKPSEQFMNSSTYDETAFGNFAKANGFSHMIRSHSLIPDDGYDLRFGNRCITIFSCSNYLRHCAANANKGKDGKTDSTPSGENDEPANACTAAFIDGGNSRIRLLSFDTKGQLAASSTSTSSASAAANGSDE